jgi:negative elongation factor B
MVGTSNKLYSNTVTSLLDNYLSSKNCFYASIRSLLLMKLHDVDASLSENLYKFTWTLNACIKERKIDAKRIKEFELIMDSKKFEKILK